MIYKSTKIPFQLKCGFEKNLFPPKSDLEKNLLPLVKNLLPPKKSLFGSQNQQQPLPPQKSTPVVVCPHCAQSHATPSSSSALCHRVVCVSLACAPLAAPPSGPASSVDAYEKLLSSIPEFSYVGKLFMVQ